MLNLLDIPKHISVLEGDTVSTSGYSTIFPKGLLVGTVREVTLPSGSNSYKIAVELFADPVTMNTAYVILNKFSQEQKTLETDTANE